MVTVQRDTFFYLRIFSYYPENLLLLNCVNPSWYVLKSPLFDSVFFLLLIREGRNNFFAHFCSDKFRGSFSEKLLSNDMSCFLEGFDSGLNNVFVIFICIHGVYNEINPRPMITAIIQKTRLVIYFYYIFL